MIKLIASDIDGTLVPEGAHKLNPEYHNIIRELDDVGIKFCACSGRQFNSMLELFEPVADRMFFICENGTLLRTKDDVLTSWKIEPEVYLPLIEEVRKIKGAKLLASTAEAGYIEAGEDSGVMHILRDNYHYLVHNTSDLAKLSPDNILKVSVYHPQVEEATKALREDPRFSHMNITTSGAEWIDIFPREAGKGEAYALLQEYLDIRIEETVYFGDNMNDLSAFSEAGVTATVANARIELKSAADKVEHSYDDNGVLRELRNILRHRRAYLLANR